MLPTYQEVLSYDKLPATDEQWTREYVKDGFYLSLITQNDKVYSYYKYDRKTNYKQSIANSLGVFEHTQVFTVINQMLATIGLLSTSHENGLKSIEELKIAMEVMQKHLTECDYKTRIDLAGGEDSKYAIQLELMIAELNKILCILQLVGACIQINGKKLAPEEAMSELLSFKGLSDHIIQSLQAPEESSNLKLSFL